ncbi:hypothetical protein MKX01_022654 [Papaver californicum]|nr:hypothetical protein MKX01_022654 [Papaver californicum]
MSNKRSRGEMEESITATMAKCLMLLSRDRGEIDYQFSIQQQTIKQFSSFQALGGHRASHKKPRLMELYSLDDQSINDNQQQAKKPKMHDCSICGLTFAIGQALGGHMRRHRTAMIESSLATTTTTGLSADVTNITRQKEVLLKRSNSSMRRGRAEMEESIEATMAKCLMLLSRDNGKRDYRSVIDQQQQTRTSTSTKDRVYECKTCNKQFQSFQALEGHRARHKTRRVMDLYSSENQTINDSQQKTKRKPKMRECSICGLKFAIRQALGGHMRKHRADMIESSIRIAATEGTGLSSSSSSDNTADTHQKELLPQVPVLKRSNNRRVLGLNLDLDLHPLDNNDLEFSAEGKHISRPSTIYSFT